MHVAAEDAVDATAVGIERVRLGLGDAEQADRQVADLEVREPRVERRVRRVLLVGAARAHPARRKSVL